jgi:hypothetical protein
MNIFIKNIYPNKYNNLYKLVDNLLLIKKFNYIDIYSEDGLFRVKNNILYKLLPIDNPTEIYNSIYLIDKSKYDYQTAYSIPHDHITCNCYQEEYKLMKKSIVTLIIQYENNNIFNIYFNVNDNYSKIDQIIINEIDTFLSILNNL